MSDGTDTNLGCVVSKDFFKWVSFDVRYEGQDRHRHTYIIGRPFHTNKPANKATLKPKTSLLYFQNREMAFVAGALWKKIRIEVNRGRKGGNDKSCRLMKSNFI